MLYDILSLGDITIDLFFKGDTLTQEKERFALAVGGKYDVDTFHESLGGGGANVAVGMARYHLNTAVCGKVGDNVFKQMIIQKLVKKSVSTEFLLVDKNYLNISSILVTKKGERSIIHFATPHSSLELSDLMKVEFKRCRQVYFGHLPGISIAEKVDLLSMFKQEDVPICLNLGAEDCEKPKTDTSQLLKYADILILNIFEFASLIKKGKSVINLKSDCSRYLDDFSRRILIITAADGGSYLYHQGAIIHEPAVKVKTIVDTTGAGDAFTAGFLATYYKTKNLEQSLREGARFAAEILGRLGAQ